MVVKQKIAVALSAVMLAAYLPAQNVFARADGRVTSTRVCVRGSELKLADAPVLVIEKSDDLSGSFTFDLYLTNAKWGDDFGNSVLQTGVSVIIMGDTKARVNVDGFDAVNNDIRIPLITEITADDNALVSIDPKNSGVSQGSFTFATAPSGEVTFKTETAELSVELSSLALNDIIIEDKNMPQVKSGDQMRLKLTNGFVFSGYESVTGEGKFGGGRVSFSISEKDPTEAFLKMKSATGSGSGSITLRGVKILPTEKTQYGDVDMTLRRDGKILTITAAKFGGDIDYSAKLTAEYDRKSLTPDFGGTGGVGRVVIVKVDGEKIGYALITNGDWKIPYPSAKAPLAEGEHKLEIGYYNPSSDKLTETMESVYSIKKEENADKPAQSEKAEVFKSISFVIGEKDYIINGDTVFSAEAAPVIVNGSTMLPIRSLANPFFGISDENVLWNNESKTVTIKTGKENIGDITVTVGGDAITTKNGSIAIKGAPAANIGGRVYLPFRALLNAAGVEDDDIKWDDAAKTVTVYK